MGMYFGEAALLTNTSRSATVRTRSYGILGRMKKEAFDNILFEFPKIK